MSHTWAKSPESIRIIERFYRTIDDQLFKLHNFETLKESEKAIGDFIEMYNKDWMLESLGYISPCDALENYYKLSKKVLDELEPEHFVIKSSAAGKS